jgi:hypothetical protein
MKKCPNCKQVFLDKYNYCLTDGVTLENIAGSDYVDKDFSSSLTESFDAPTIKFTDSKETSVPTLPRNSIETSIKNGKWLYLAIGVLIAAISMAGYVMYQPEALPTPTEETNPSGRWKGEWSSSNGNQYSADVNLNSDGANNFSGHIVWTLKQSRTRKKENIGATAIEHIEGTFNPVTRLLDVKGVRKDDPHGIVILDKYQLTLGADNQSLIGSSLNGKLNLKR